MTAAVRGIVAILVVAVLGVGQALAQDPFAGFRKDAAKGAAAVGVTDPSGKAPATPAAQKATKTVYQFTPQEAAQVVKMCEVPAHRDLPLCKDLLPRAGSIFQEAAKGG